MIDEAKRPESTNVVVQEILILQEENRKYGSQHKTSKMESKCCKTKRKILGKTVKN